MTIFNIEGGIYINKRYEFVNCIKIDIEIQREGKKVVFFFKKQNAIYKAIRGFRSTEM